MQLKMQQDPEEVAVDVLQDQREPGLAAVAAVGVGHAAGRRRQPEGPVVGLAVVVAGEAEAEREDEDQQRRRVVPEGQRPEGVAARHAAVGDAGRVEGRDQVPVQVGPGVVVLPHEGGPRRVDDEGQQDRRRDRRLDPPAVLAQGGHVRPAPGRPDRNRCRGCALDRRRHSHLLSAQLNAQLSPRSGPAVPYGPLKAHVKDIKSMKFRAIRSELCSSTSWPTPWPWPRSRASRRPPPACTWPSPRCRARSACSSTSWACCSSTGAPARGRSPSRPTAPPSCPSCSASWPTWRPPGPRRGRCRAWPGGAWPSGPPPASSPARWRRPSWRSTPATPASTCRWWRRARTSWCPRWRRARSTWPWSCCR